MAVTEDMAMLEERNNSQEHTSRAELQLQIDDSMSLLELSRRAAEYETAFAAEFQPEGALAEFLVRQMGRFAAGADFYAAAHDAAIRFAANSPEAASLFPGVPVSDRAYLVALSSRPVAAASRSLTRSHRSLSTTVHEYLSLVQKVGFKQNGSVTSAFATKLFKDEAACEAYLESWQLEQPWSCPHCHGGERYALQTRAALECACKKQISIRHATIFAQSRVSLLAWFRLVTAVIATPHASASQLSSIVDIRRLATVRQMQTSVVEALQAADANQRLAGLPSYVLAYLRQVSDQPTSSSPSPDAAPAATQSNGISAEITTYSDPGIVPGTPLRPA